MIHDKIIAAAVSKEGLPSGGLRMMLSKWGGLAAADRLGGPAAADRLMRRSGWL